MTLLEEMEAESACLKAHLRRARKAAIADCAAELELETNRYAREMLTSEIEELRAELAATEQPQERGQGEPEPDEAVGTFLEEMETEIERVTVHFKRAKEAEIEEWTAWLEHEENHYSREMLTRWIEELRAELATGEQ